MEKYCTAVYYLIEDEKKDLATELNISLATIAKMGKGESVSMDVLERICSYMNCNIGDIMIFEDAIFFTK